MGVGKSDDPEGQRDMQVNYTARKVSLCAA